MAPGPFDHLDPTRKALALERVREKLYEVRSVAVPQLQQLVSEIARRTRLQAIEDRIPAKLKALLQPSRNKGAHGGRGSAKSWTFALLTLLRCLKRKGTRIVCVREVQKSLEHSVKQLLEDLIQSCDLGTEFKVLTTHIETPGDGIIIFQGMQNHTAESIKSLEGYDVAWVEEAQSLSQTSLDLLRPTLRKEDSELWFSWNPTHESDPVDNFLRATPAPPDTIVVEVNYHDNPYLPEVLRREMEWDRSRDIDKYNHVWLGFYQRRSQARVIKNFRVQEFDTPIDVEFLLGGDWGFAIDPAVCVRSFIIGRTLYIDWEAYKVGCEIDDTPFLFDSIGCTQSHIHTPQLIGTVPAGTLVGHCSGMARKYEIVADSARPETISYMQRHGYPRMRAAKKGQGSVEDGLEFLKNYDIIIHPRCEHVIDEASSYSYKVHSLTGQVLPVLVDKKNHTIDSCRYMLEPVRNPVDEAVVW